jgi:hypothetical protein
VLAYWYVPPHPVYFSSRLRKVRSSTVCKEEELKWETKFTDSKASAEH